jgi:hypothetical protein
MTTTNPTFTINTLTGNSFSVTIDINDASKIYNEQKNIYDRYGLDFLKDAISKETGINPVCQQLFAEDGELTILSSLTDVVGLWGSELILLEKPSLKVKFTTTTCYGINGFMLETRMRAHYHHLKNRTNFPLDQPGCHVFESDKKLSICQLFSMERIPDIEVIGMDRDFLCIRLRDIPSDYLKEPRPFYGMSTLKDYEITPTDPEFTWLRFCSDYMEILS